MIELCCEFFSVRYIWLYVITMFCVIAWMLKNSLLETGAIFEV